jgi:hypothetical protein
VLDQGIRLTGVATLERGCRSDPGGQGNQGGGKGQKGGRVEPFPTTLGGDWSRQAAPRHRPDDRNHFTAIVWRDGTLIDVRKDMRTIQIPLGEIIEATYDELMRSFGDEDLALVAAEAIAYDLLTRPVSED